jgi:anti-sigma B factor antagonist
MDERHLAHDGIDLECVRRIPTLEDELTLEDALASVRRGRLRRFRTAARPSGRATRVGARPRRWAMLEQSLPRPTSLRLEGDIDTASVPSVSEPLFRLLERGDCSDLRIDCSGVTFIDARGLSMMARAQRIADEGGCTLTWLDPSPQLMRMLSLTGMHEYLTISITA